MQACIGTAMVLRRQSQVLDDQGLELCSYGRRRSHYMGGTDGAVRNRASDPPRQRRVGYQPEQFRRRYDALAHSDKVAPDLSKP